MATVTNTVKLPDGSTPDRVDVVIELVASTTGKAAGWITATDVTLEATVRPTVTAGAWSVSLTPNANITPSGSVYKVTEYVDKTRYIHYIEVGSGGGSLFDLLVDPPASVATAALTSHLREFYPLLALARSTAMRPFPTLHADPPYIWGASTTSRIDNGILWASVSGESNASSTMAAHYYSSWGTKWIRYGSTDPENTWARPANITDATHETGFKGGYAIDFWFDGTELEIVTGGHLEYVKLWVDDQPTTAAQGWLISPDDTYYCKATFRSRAMRRIRVESNQGRFGGVVTGPGDSISPAPTGRPRCVWVGDSFTDSVGADNGVIDGLPRQTGHLLGWDVTPSGIGSTGYLNPGIDTTNFRDRVQNDVIDQNPDIVVVAGGINDRSYSASALQTEAETLFAEIKAGLPNVVLIVISPFFYQGCETTTFMTSLLPAYLAVKAAAATADALFVDVIEIPLEGAAASGSLAAAVSATGTSFSSATAFPLRSTVEIGNGTDSPERRIVRAVSGSGPYSHTVTALSYDHDSDDDVVQVGSCFYTGTGRVGATTGDGNCDYYVSSDAVHPSQAGHDAHAAQIASQILRIFRDMLEP